MNGARRPWQPTRLETAGTSPRSSFGKGAMTVLMSGPRGSVAYSRQPDAPAPVAADYIEFAAMDSTPRWSREFVAKFLDRYTDYSASGLTEKAAVIVSELATNTVEAARKLIRPTVVWLSVRLFHDHLLAEVIDSSPAVPVLLEEMDVFAEHGRGLHLVDALSEGRWGWFRWPPPPGRKVAWCRLVT
ncbi:MAG: ATP-binding protein [Trebonia sp.]